jgi:hypothetical protein
MQSLGREPFDIVVGDIVCSLYGSDVPVLSR